MDTVRAWSQTEKPILTKIVWDSRCRRDPFPALDRQGPQRLHLRGLDRVAVLIEHTTRDHRGCHQLENNVADMLAGIESQTKAHAAGQWLALAVCLGNVTETTSRERILARI